MLDLEGGGGGGGVLRNMTDGVVAGLINFWLHANNIGIFMDWTVEKNKVCDEYKNALNRKLSIEVLEISVQFFLTLFDMGGGGGMMAPQNVFNHCAETFWSRKLKHCDFYTSFHNSAHSTVVIHST